MANQLLYGFHNLADVKNNLIDAVGIPVVTDAVTKAVAEQNRVLDAMLALFVIRTTEFKLRFKTSVNARLQPLDEFGRARPIKALGFYDIALPIFPGGSAWGVDYTAARKMTVQEANDATVTMLNADRNWVRDHLMAALFLGANWTFYDDLRGDLIIKPLANGDTDKYQITAGANAQQTANHLYAQAAAISDAANPFRGIYTKLTSHPENSGQVVVLVASNLVPDIENLANFKEYADSDIRQGANSDVLVGTLNAAVPGTIIGKVDKCWIVEWNQIPDGYLIAVTTGGEKPLAMREDAESSLRGFNKADERNDYPFYETQYLRRAGFGAWNRVGALVGKIGSATYSVPVGYESPMA